MTPPGAGTTITKRGTPATLAGTAFINTEDGYAAPAAGHVESHRLDRGPPRSKLYTQRIGEAVVLRHLPAVIHLDAIAGEIERIECMTLALG